ncbi:DUF7370 family protein [Entomohabitans teleogrylli]|uniref:DUF7370 family protein n=1 Tax=Entomohabitans teleogrylli TaxID=1384589 RepID=UPI00073D4C30|nr:hypothetical protein [Entomohabitans teleogrylli]
MVIFEQASEYLDGQGVNLPEFLLNALIEQVNSIQECLDANYPESTALLIQMYLLGLLALAQGDKYISSQHAPNGASQSFRYQSFADRWSGSLNLLRSLDREGCATNLIPPDPTVTAFGGLWIGRGGCMCGN